MKIVAAVVTGLLALAHACAADASFHLMQVEQAIGGIAGDATQQAIQLRMRAPGQTEMQFSRLRVFDAIGANPVVLIAFPTRVTNGAAGDRVLVASAAFAARQPIAPDFVMANMIPAAYFAGGKLSFEDNGGGVLYSLCWGSYSGSSAGSLDNDDDGQYGPCEPGPLPSTAVAALRFGGEASAKGTTNAADFSLTPGAAEFTNNARARGAVVEPALFANGFEPATGNSVPIARAGADQAVFVVASVTVDGSASSDADGQTLTFAWTFASRPAGSTAILRNPATAVASFDPDIPGDYVLQLVVNDGVTNSLADTLVVTATSQVVRFAVIGAQGQGNAGQLSVANAIAARCARDGCDYVIGLGNNIYPSGASSPDDQQFATAFATPYAGVALPFWLGLGNRDYGSSGTDFPRALNEIAHSSVDAKWRMPSHYYRRPHQHVEFFTLDTNGEWLSNPATASQGADITGWIAASTAYWKITLGLHSYKSNGTHGNAGSYDDIPFGVTSGARIRDFVEDRICGRTHAYFSAYDHNLQWLQQDPVNCPGTELIVSGAAATTTTLTRSNPTHFESAVLGFAYVVIRDRRMSIAFVDTSGATLFERSVSR